MKLEGVSITVTYFNVRGRCEPVLLILEDAGISYTLRELTLEEWKGYKSRGEIGPPTFPYNGLPVINIMTDEGQTDILAETCAILRFLDKCLRVDGTEVSA